VPVTRPLLIWGLRFLVAALLLYLLFRFIPFADVIQVLAQADPFWVAAAFVVLVLERLSVAWRMKLLADQLQMRLSTRTIFEINMSSVFYTTFLPGDLAGGAVRWYRMSQPNGRRAEAFAALVFERLIDTIVLLASGLLFWLWDRPPFATDLLNFLLVGLLGALSIGMVASLSPALSPLLARVIACIPGRRLRTVLHEKTEKVLVSVREFRRLSVPAVSGVILLSMLRHVLSILIFVCFAHALAVTIGFATIGWIRSLLNIITMLPVAFAGLGVREATFVILLEPYGVPGSQALALALTAFIVHIVLALAGGLLELKRLFGNAGDAPRNDNDPESAAARDPNIGR
jgi:glycosyltransferase 2 family protein